MYVCIYIYIYVYIIYIYTFHLPNSQIIYVKCQITVECQMIYIKNKTFIYLKVILQFLSNLQRLNEIRKKCKKYKSGNWLKSNESVNKTVVKSNV